MRRKNLLIFILFLGASPAHALFDEARVSSRAAGMGNAYIGAANGASGVYYNPAGLFQLRGTEIETMYANKYSIDGLDLNYAGAATGEYRFFNRFPLGFAYISENARNILKEEQFLFATGYLYENWIALGFTAGYYRFSPSGYQEVPDPAIRDQSTWGLNIGLQFKPWQPLTIAAVYNKIGVQLGGDEAGMDLKAGFAYRVTPSLLLVGDFKKGPDRNDQNNITLHYGLEKNLNENLAVRIGMDDKDLTLGGSAAVGHWTLDYGFSMKLQRTHSMSMKWKF